MEGSGGLWLPGGHSTLSPSVDALFNFVNIVSLILFLGVVFVMVFLAYRFRRRGPNDRPTPVKENKAMEIAWIAVPTILVLVTFFWGFTVYVKIQVAPPDSYLINVTGRQWSWAFQYPNGAQTVNEIHVPVNRPVRLQMSSEDVLHSLFIPVFRVKQDVLPNRYSYVWFEATDVGEYPLFCTEYCGTSHSGMWAKVVVESQEEFDAWLKKQPAGGADLPPAEYGALLYAQQGCQACHSVDGSTKIGPSFKGIFGHEQPMEGGATVEVDENYLRESILQPNAQVVAGFPPVTPSSYSNLEEAQITALVEYIKTLK